VEATGGYDHSGESVVFVGFFYSPTGRLPGKPDAAQAFLEKAFDIKCVRFAGSAMERNLLTLPREPAALFHSKKTRHCGGLKLRVNATSPCPRR
jgi:hypothetical protein